MHRSSECTHVCTLHLLFFRYIQLTQLPCPIAQSQVFHTHSLLTCITTHICSSGILIGISGSSCQCLQNPDLVQITSDRVSLQENDYRVVYIQDLKVPIAGKACTPPHKVLSDVLQAFVAKIPLPALQPPTVNSLLRVTPPACHTLHVASSSVQPMHPSLL